MAKSPIIGFVGAGQMASALAQGFVGAHLISGEQVIAFDPSAAAIEAFSAAVPGATAAGSNAELGERADVILLAVKPQYAKAATEALQPAITPEKLVISIMAGATLNSLASWLGTERLVRVMPNTPCLVGQSAAGYCLGTAATDDDGKLVGDLLRSVGLAVQLEERLIDAVTGLSGSGPAYVYVMIEALADGGVQMGLPREAALQLAAQTVRGAAEMVLGTGEHPAVLKDKVASPGGTTIAGLAALENAGARAALIEAVAAATERSRELGQD